MKLQYLTVYEVVRSIRLLVGESNGALTSNSLRATARILSLPDVDRLVSGTGGPLRNSLMHYDIDSRIPVNSCRLNQILYGMVEATLGVSIDDFEESVRRLAGGIGSELDEWSGKT